ncbi:hypothetical protein CRG98_034082 [Punica granatum]|uniref:Uncharacterized protein n=1 Tax=Punica granatum TaxID=22663 RepID=A0A2I0INI7_PUNGR|nr:hypothetical protein CRG98_034082 [Punica granatum]
MGLIETRVRQGNEKRILGCYYTWSNRRRRVINAGSWIESWLLKAGYLDHPFLRKAWSEQIVGDPMYQLYGASVDELNGVVQRRLSLEQQNLLKAEFTAEEIKSSMLSLAGNKAPGTNGFTSQFFKASWNITDDLLVFMDGSTSFVAALSDVPEQFYTMSGLSSQVLGVVGRVMSSLGIKDVCDVEQHMYDEESMIGVGG